MCAVWLEKGWSPNAAVEMLEKARSKTDKGVSYKSMDYEEYSSIVLSCIDFKVELPNLVKESFLKKALFKDTHRLSKDFIIDQVDKAEKEYLRQPKKSFVLKSSVNAFGAFPFDVFSVGECKISLKGNFRKFDAKDQFEDLKFKSHQLNAKNYNHCIVNVVSRSDWEAAENAIKALNLFCALVNLRLNLHRNRRISSGKRTPINKLRTGPIHTIHDPTGKSALGVYWYNPTHLEFGDKLNWREIDTEKRLDIFYFRNKLKHCKFRNRVEKCLLAYQSALDNWDWDKSFTILWTVIEQLTMTESERYDVTVRRLQTFYRQTSVTKELAQHLRLRRNYIIHSNSEYDDIEMLLFQAKGVAENLLLFWLRNFCKLQNEDEMRSFLSSPNEVQALKRQKFITNEKLNFRSR